MSSMTNRQWYSYSTDVQGRGHHCIYGTDHRAVPRTLERWHVLPDPAGGWISRPHCCDDGVAGTYPAEKEAHAAARRALRRRWPEASVPEPGEA